MARNDLNALVAATAQRAASALAWGSARGLGFDTSRKFASMSAELLQHLREADACGFRPVEVKTNCAEVLELLTEDFR
eukprot:5363655-Pleurochrysis_carterae.AAC.1